VRQGRPLWRAPASCRDLTPRHVGVAVGAAGPGRVTGSARTPPPPAAGRQVALGCRGIRGRRPRWSARELPAAAHMSRTAPRCG